IDKYIYSAKSLSNEDRELIITFILLSTEVTTFEQLAEFCSVSKQTAISSLNKVITDYENNKLTLQRLKGFGMSLVGNEYYIRSYFIRLLTEVKLDDWIIDLVFKQFYCEPNITIARQIIRQVEKDMNAIYLDQQKIEIFICYCLHRIVMNHELDTNTVALELSAIKNHPDFKRLLQSMIPFPINENEKFYLCWIFMNERFNTTTDEGYIHKEDSEAIQIANFLMEKLLLLHPLDRQAQEYFIKGLSQHLKVALYRIRYNIAIKNELLDQIKISIPLIYEYTKNQLLKCEKTYNVIFDENEIAYIAMYVASTYENSLKVDTQLNVLLVCSFGVATSSILKTRIEYSLPECTILGPIPKFEANELLKKQKVDLVISTNEVDFAPIPVITVNPLLFPEDLEYIKTRLFQLSYSHMCNSFLKAYAHQEKTIGSKTYIHDLVDFNHIQIIDSCDSWEKAIHIAVEPLLKEEVIEMRYVNKMIEAVNKLGTYMVLVPETAFIHAGTEDGIRENCTAILILKEPITFGNKNSKLVRNLVLLGVKNKDENALLDLVYIFEKTQNLDVLKSLNITKEIVFNLHD
ncbi:MAG: PTS sugar transporter subunit IIA, partial [Coprobacillus sp.]